MGYTTDFSGSISVEPPLSQEEIAFLTKFNETRRMARKKGPYYVDNAGFCGLEAEEDILDYNRPPSEQPSLWCQWRPTDDGCAIEWDGVEKFYESPTWMKYLIEHFIGSDPKAKSKLPFLTGHTCNGRIEAQGEDRNDRWALIVENNTVSVAQATISTEYQKPQKV